jgi:hypothetical protein
MGVAAPSVSAAVRQVVESKGIRYHRERQVTAVDNDARRIRFSNGKTAEFNLLVYVPPHRAPSVVTEAGLTGESGWISVDRATFETRHPGVYALIAGSTQELMRRPRRGILPSSASGWPVHEREHPEASRLGRWDAGVDHAPNQMRPLLRLSPIATNGCGGVDPCAPRPALTSS